MIAGGDPYVVAAYAVTSIGLASMTLIVVLRLFYWAKRAKQIGAPK